MAKKPFFSIVIPTYNRASDLKFALFCILRQTFRDFEIVISDNYSTDDTENVVSEFHDARIRYTKTQRVLWNSYNIERAMQLAKGTYIFLHSDDDFLLYDSSLATIHREILHHRCGYIRLNYLSLSLDKKNIFAYRLKKSFKEDTFFPQLARNTSILSFILDSDPYFISGIIIKNAFPKHIRIVDSDPAPWINILFYVTRKFGALFLVTPHLIAQWSRREIRKNQVHHIFSLINGKLRSEQYLDAVRSKISSKEYKKFLIAELYLLYVECFPMIKAKVGNVGLKKLSGRILTLAPEIKKEPSYWILFILAFALPESIWKFLRVLYLWLYARVSKADNFLEVIEAVHTIEAEFTSDRR